MAGGGSNDEMAHYSYVIVGGGMTGYAAAQAIRRKDASAEIAMFTREVDPPYRRPPLTKGLWKGDGLDKTMYDAARLNLALQLETTVTEVLPDRHAFKDDAGGEHTYGSLLLATGGTPRRLPYGDDNIIYYRTLADYRRLRALTEGGASIAVIGGGFIGSELAAGLAMNDCRVTMILPEPAIGGRNYPEDLARYVTDYFGERGVRVLTRTSIRDFKVEGGHQRLMVEREGGGAEEIVADGTVAGIGITPNTSLAEAAGLRTANGIVVDRFLRTSAPDVYAAGDVAAFDSPALGPSVRVEHEDNARNMGRVAGENMAGGDAPYDYLPFFYSDLFDLGYEAVGMLDARLETFSDWVEPFKKGVIYYMEAGRVRGVLLWNVWDKVDAARELVQSGAEYRREDLAGKLTAKKQ
jgi:NADPH-dependent 2,4-dienoyl-CoA reductase/sulfur reductase-like enzyme